MLSPAYEFELDGELVCQGPGPTVYQSAPAGILYYIGPELVGEARGRLNRSRCSAPIA